MYKLVKRVFSHLLSVSLSLVAVGGLIVYKIDQPSEPSINDLIQQNTVIGHLLEQSPIQLEKVCDGDEFQWLACGIYFEARNQIQEGQMYVAQVILNRVEDPRWPNSIEGVIRQGEEKKYQCQFSFMCDGEPELIKDAKAWQVASNIAHQAMEEYYDGAIVTCAHSYHADYVTNEKALKWFGTLKRDEQVGTHIFYC